MRGKHALQGREGETCIGELVGSGKVRLAINLLWVKEGGRVG